jgi:small subunit ribosomal protein S2e
MADAAPRRGGFGSRGDRGGDRGRGRGRRGRRGGAKSEEKEWQPVTKLGRLVKAGKITSMEQIYLHSLPVKEYQIVDFFLPKLKDEVMKVRLFFSHGFSNWLWMDRRIKREWDWAFR